MPLIIMRMLTSMMVHVFHLYMDVRMRRPLIMMNQQIQIMDSCIAVVEGCTDETAFNYNQSANTDDGSCIAVVEGCLDESACNYESEANTDDESCEYAEQYYDCDGVCLLDSDGDGVCDELEVLGCTDSDGF